MVTFVRSDSLGEQRALMMTCTKLILGNAIYICSEKDETVLLVWLCSCCVHVNAADMKQCKDRFVLICA